MDIHEIKITLNMFQKSKAEVNGFVIIGGPKTAVVEGTRKADVDYLPYIRRCKTLWFRIEIRGYRGFELVWVIAVNTCRGRRGDIDHQCTNGHIIFALAFTNLKFLTHTLRFLS
ncbi:hypothetical protein JTB14_022744 [Gonioctena quinquepunctata]|nr:hypothetical protein JTB14_022744 [Gonioctena quinquepunctata]